jgi:hypothetical protein
MLPQAATSAELDMKVESISTMLTYLELCDPPFIRNLPCSFSRVDVVFRGKGGEGPAEVAEQSPVIAALLKAGKRKGKAGAGGKAGGAGKFSGTTGAVSADLLRVSELCDGMPIGRIRQEFYKLSAGGIITVAYSGPAFWFRILRPLGEFGGAGSGGLSALSKCSAWLHSATERMTECNIRKVETVYRAFSGALEEKAEVDHQQTVLREQKQLEQQQKEQEQQEQQKEQQADDACQDGSQGALDNPAADADGVVIGGSGAGAVSGAGEADAAGSGSGGLSAHADLGEGDGSSLLHSLIEKYFSSTEEAFRDSVAAIPLPLLFAASSPAFKADAAVLVNTTHERMTAQLKSVTATCTVDEMAAVVGIACARVLHGMASPGFPLQEWKKNQFWKQHPRVAFRELQKAAEDAYRRVILKGK